MSVPALRFKDEAGRGFPKWEEKRLEQLDVGRISRANNTDCPSCLSSGRGVIRRTCGVALPFGGLRRTETPCYPKHKRLVRLIRPTALDNPKAREWYATECLANNWSVRALERQISTLPR